MITALDFPADPHEQIQYRFLALALENERPDQFAALTAQYNQMYKRVADALARFNDLNNATPATEPDISNAIAGYQYVQSEIKDAVSLPRPHRRHEQGGGDAGSRRAGGGRPGKKSPGRSDQ